jgi:hypothetical protein
VNIKLRLESFLFYILIFLIPSQLSYHFWPEYSFVYGFRIDYLAPTIYLTDILILFVILLWVWRDGKVLLSYIKKRLRYVLVGVFIVLLNILFSSEILVSLLKWIKFIEFGMLGFYVFVNNYYSERTIYMTLFLSATFFATIGIWQVLKGGTIGLYLFGERSFSQSTPGIALASVGGREILRAYSTFSHPNSFAGYLGVIIILFVSAHKILKNKYFLLALFPIILVFILTFSLSSLVAILLVGLFYLIAKKDKHLRILTQSVFFVIYFSSMIIPVFAKKLISLLNETGPSVVDRLKLSYLAGKMIAGNFLTGTGLNTFIINIPLVNKGMENFWELQPVHNVFLSVFSEGGIFVMAGLFVLINIIIKNVNSKHLFIIIFILITSFFDHYWISLQQNLLLLSVLGGIYIRKT